MGRYLPWRDGPGDGSRPRKRVKASMSIDGFGAGEKKTKDDHEVVSREDEYMRDGIKNDDRYIMVEDELLQIAKSYTAKLHSAELERLQAQIALRKNLKVAASQHSQPRIAGSMSKQRQVVLHRRAHDAAVRRAAGITGDEAEPYNHKFSSQSLSRLMTTSATRIDSSLPLPLTPGKTIKPATRAAAGFTKASFNKALSSQILPSQVRSSQVAMQDYNDIDRESDEEDDEDLDLVSRRPGSTRVPQKMTPIESPTSSSASEKRVSVSKHPHPSTNYEPKLLSSSPQSFKKPPLLSSSPPPPSRALSSSKSSQRKPIFVPDPGPPVADSDSDNDYADAEQAARWRRRRMHKPPIAPASGALPTSRLPASTPKPTPAMVDSSDENDYADAEQAARFRRRQQLLEAQKSSARS
ncbi:hypothetical protein TWF730_009814 [Orbilia blumenaviensis]|uniref:Uncharacterized protein n=1 Tax=Orbilia blumenaviensis TaxID=1796055 RepID=A0AAV9UVC6_9PEZI